MNAAEQAFLLIHEQQHSVVRADRFQQRVPGRAGHETSPSVRAPGLGWWPGSLATRTVEAGSALVHSDLQFPAEATRVSPHKAAARQEMGRQLAGSSN